MSPRAQVAENIAAFIRDNDLDSPFGGDVTKDKRYYAVLLSRPRILDGLIRVYSPKFILIQLQGPLAQGSYQAVYTSEEDAINFLRLFCVECDQDEALAIPTKQAA